LLIAPVLPLIFMKGIEGSAPPLLPSPVPGTGNSSVLTAADHLPFRLPSAEIERV